MSDEQHMHGWRKSALIKGVFSGDTSDVDYILWKQGDAPGPWVYVVSAVGSGRIKIGYTSGPISLRMRGLETGCPFPPKLLAVMRGTRELEKDLHRTFASQRRHLEWFEDSPAIRKLLRELAVNLRGITWGLDQTG